MRGRVLTALFAVAILCVAAVGSAVAAPGLLDDVSDGDQAALEAEGAEQVGALTSGFQRDRNNNNDDDCDDSGGSKNDCDDGNGGGDPEVLGASFASDLPSGEDPSGNLPSIETGGFDPGSGEAGTLGARGGAGTRVVAAAQVGRQGEGESGGRGLLPFTGLEIVLPLLAGALLLTGGLMLRGRARRS